MLKITKATAYKHRATDSGPPGYRIGKHLRFKRSDVLSWLETKKDSREVKRVGLVEKDLQEPQSAP
jgi:predicted DNA-binding transcriptional regulator AlpA